MNVKLGVWMRIVVALACVPGVSAVDRQLEFPPGLWPTNHFADLDGDLGLVQSTNNTILFAYRLSTGALLDQMPAHSGLGSGYDSDLRVFADVVGSPGTELEFAL